MTTQAKLPEFEQSLDELQEIVELLEKGEMSLQESLKAFEQGVQLSASCEKTLNEAEQRIEQVLDGSLDESN